MRTLKGRKGLYKAKRIVGSGGFGDVLEGISETGEKVAIKLFSGHFNEEIRNRYLMEYTKVQNLHHPNIVRILDVLETPSGNRTFALGYVMEWLPQSIAEYLLPLPLSKRIDVFQQVIEGVAFLHNHDMAHRDIKPANIRVRKDGTPVLIDFGMAFWGPEASVTLLYAGTLDPIYGGTLLYMPPEVMALNPHVISRSSVCRKAFAALAELKEPDRGVIQRKLHDVYSLGMTALLLFHPSIRTPKELLEYEISLAKEVDRDPDRFYQERILQLLKEIEKARGSARHLRILQDALAPEPSRRILSAQDMLGMWTQQEEKVSESPGEKPIQHVPYVWCVQCRKSYPIPPSIRIGNVRFCPGCGAPAHHHLVVDAEGLEREIPLPPEAFPLPRQDGAVEFVLPVNTTLRITLGRDEGNMWKIRFPSISRKHVELILSPEGLEIQNLNPRLSTYLNGDPLEPHARVPVRFHGVVSLGDLVFILYDRIFFGGAP